MIHTHKLIENLSEFIKSTPIANVNTDTQEARDYVEGASAHHQANRYYIDHLQRAVQFQCDIDEYYDSTKRWEELKQHTYPDGFQELRLPYPLMYVEMYPSGGLLLRQDNGSKTIYGYPFMNYKNGGWNVLTIMEIRIDTITRKMHGIVGEVPTLTDRQKKLLYNTYRATISAEQHEKITNQVSFYVGVLRYMLDVLNCNNVGLEDNHPEKKIAKKRAKLGREPLFSYKTLTIIAPKKPKNKNDDNEAGDDAASSSGEGSDRTSPRLHLRRGHIRRLSPERTTWVTSCMVGTSGNGAVAKDYKITTQQRREQ